ncbi:hypothetical protein N185_32460 [Sinorhizobium sp. GW3]|nr:hypothetical protein N185_32460 [Sinorhizobium sp. GW3]
MGPKKISSEVSLTAKAYERLRNDIITCRLRPDERLRLEELRDRYDVGASSLREAMMRLEVEGLVLLEPNKGFRVSPVSAEHLLDVMTARAEIDALCLRWSIEKGDVTWESAIVGALHGLRRFSKHSGDDAGQENWRIAHRSFHFALISACGSETFKTFHSTLFDQVERYIAISISMDLIPRDDNTEHEEIVRATLDRQSDLAVKLLKEHLMKTYDKLAAGFSGAYGDGLGLTSGDAEEV